MKMKVYRHIIGVVGVCLLLIAAASCQRVDLSLLDTQHYYHTQCNGKDVVMHVDSLDAQSVYGRWYATADERIVKPQQFCATLKRRNKMEVQAAAFPSGMTAMVNLDFSAVTVDFAINGHPTTLRFVPLEEPAFISTEGAYICPIYQTKCQTDIVYGQASGYWNSYPELAGSNNDYVRIVKPKVKELLLEKSVSLTMDVYQPVCGDTIRRPLLMLIHGGAFFNGDKQTQAFKRWSEYFASLGYVVASINYRLGFGPTKEGVDRAGYKAVQDAHAAMRYLVHHADEYHIDTRYLFVGGSSAGGITALNLAFMRNENRPSTVYDGRFRLTGDNDLGFINAVSPHLTDTFAIKAVVNMWGAVHDTAMLRNSRQTAILSFHGDADRIVAYDYDYPFMDPPTPLRDVLALFDVPPPPNMRPINEILFDKMYGSSCIHRQALALGMRSELHTYPNGPHSLHENMDGTLSDYFKVIQDTTTFFLYQLLVPSPSELTELPDGPQWFGMTNASALQSTSWKVEGGVILKSEKDKIKVFFFGDAPEYKIHISGKYRNGVGLMDLYVLQNNNLIKQ